MEKQTIKLQAVEIVNFGKVSFVYKAMCPKGEIITKRAISMSSKPDSKRQTMSVQMLKAYKEASEQAGLPIDFVIGDVKMLPRAKKPAIGSDPLQLEASAKQKIPNMDFSL